MLKNAEIKCEFFKFGENLSQIRNQMNENTYVLNISHMISCF